MPLPIRAACRDITAPLYRRFVLVGGLVLLGGTMPAIAQPDPKASQWVPGVSSVSDAAVHTAIVLAFKRHGRAIERVRATARPDTSEGIGLQRLRLMAITPEVSADVRKRLSVLLAHHDSAPRVPVAVARSRVNTAKRLAMAVMDECPLRLPRLRDCIARMRDRSVGSDAYARQILGFVLAMMDDGVRNGLYTTKVSWWDDCWNQFATNANNGRYHWTTSDAEGNSIDCDFDEPGLNDEDKFLIADLLGAFGGATGGPAGALTGAAAGSIAVVVLS